MAQLSAAVPSDADEALRVYRALPAPGPAPGRYWKVDVSSIDAERLPRTAARPALAFDTSLRARGLEVCDLEDALREHADAVAAAQGSAVDWRAEKYAALNVAYRDGGAFVFIPPGLAVEQPIELTYRIGPGATYPYTLVVAGRGSRATIVSRLEGGAADSLADEVIEAIVDAEATLTFAAVQELEPSVRVFSTKRGKIAAGGELRWAVAELGAGLSVGSVHSTIEEPGVRSSISGVFFADGDQHVDLESEVDHRVGNTQSETLFKSAAAGRGQARFLGNIRIHPHAHGTEATLRDDALLLSKTAHIDSVPALEIAANDVKAFHGATVGAIDEDEVFYATTRGIERGAAERMITLGFFEPAIARFPTEALRERLRAAIARKVG